MDREGAAPAAPDATSAANAEARPVVREAPVAREAGSEEDSEVDAPAARVVTTAAVDEVAPAAVAGLAAISVAATAVREAPVAPADLAANRSRKHFPRG